MDSLTSFVLFILGAVVFFAVDSYNDRLAHHDLLPLILPTTAPPLQTQQQAIHHRRQVVNTTLYLNGRRWICPNENKPIDSQPTASRVAEVFQRIRSGDACCFLSNASSPCEVPALHTLTTGFDSIHIIGDSLFREHFVRPLLEFMLLDKHIDVDGLRDDSYCAHSCFIANNSSSSRLPNSSALCPQIIPTASSLKFKAHSSHFFDFAPLPLVHFLFWTNFDGERRRYQEPQWSNATRSIHPLRDFFASWNAFVDGRTGSRLYLLSAGRWALAFCGWLKDDRYCDAEFYERGMHETINTLIEYTSPQSLVLWVEASTPRTERQRDAPRVEAFNDAARRAITARSNDIQWMFFVEQARIFDEAASNAVPDGYHGDMSVGLEMLRHIDEVARAWMQNK
jgi:hypothetical protein